LKKNSPKNLTPKEQIIVFKNGPMKGSSQKKYSQVLVAHNYNPGYSGGRDQGAGKKQKKQFMRAYLEKKLT
jgi:hypothetical protein